MMPKTKTYKERYLKILEDGSKHGNKPGKTRDDKLDKLFEEMNHLIYLSQRDIDTLKREMSWILEDPIIGPMIQYRDKIRILEGKVDSLIEDIRHLENKTDEHH